MTEQFKSIQALSEASLKDNIIHNVHVLGFVSKNGNTYAEAAVRKAVAMYENVDVYLNHTDSGKPRLMENKIGVLRGISFKEGSGIWANELVMNPKHQEFDKIKWWAENFPSKLGMSHVAAGLATGTAGNRVIEEIKAVESVDLVPNPATVAGLHESLQNAADDAQIHLDKLIEANYTHAIGLLFDTTLDIATRKSELAKLTESLLSQLKETAMEIDWSKVTVEDIRKNCAPHVETLVKEAVEAAKTEATAAGAKIERTVQEALAKVPTESRSAVFEEQVRAVADNAEKLTALVEDRIKVSKVVEALPGKNAGTTKDEEVDPSKLAESVRSIYPK